ncbi:MAG: hypothetical protein ACTS47_00975 [Candidatus Hodgkinia cicadicola]
MRERTKVGWNGENRWTFVLKGSRRLVNNRRRLRPTLKVEESRRR